MKSIDETRAHLAPVGELLFEEVGPVSATTVAKILRQDGVSPAGGRAERSWREFPRTHAASMIACDFFTVETLWLGSLCVLFFIDLGARRVHLAGAPQTLTASGPLSRPGSLHARSRSDPSPDPVSDP